MNKLAQNDVPPLCYTLSEAAKAIRWGVTSLREEIDKGRLRKLPGRGRRIVIRAEALKDFLDLLEREQAAK